ncbi:hypothetical protein VE04_04312 [Pseudogymnoascus sp. 24MN13]|nr:hypothetical protein VE04_04312 [Pseudogymnoascus sp. 24MN13]
MAQHADGHSVATEEPREIKPDSVIQTQLIILGCFPLAEGVAWATIFPYIYSMVKSLSGSKSSKDNIAIYAGLMVSVFNFGEFVGAPLWAKVSDRIGRKPTMLIGSIGAVFSALLFGFSTSIPMAIAARTCAGLLNPNLGVVQTFVGELVSKKQEAKGFSTVSFLRGFGTIIGPVIGGYLAQPVKNYPCLFHEGTIWDKFPYLLPNLVVVMFLLSSCTLGLFCLEEVHPEFRDQVDIRWILVSRIRNIFRGTGWSSGEGTYTSLRADETDVEAPVVPASSTEALEERGVKPPSAFTRQVKLQILSVVIQGFLKISTLAIVPVFLATPSGPDQPLNLTRGSEVIRGILGVKGGFGLDTMNTSKVLLSQAAAAIGGQILYLDWSADDVDNSLGARSGKVKSTVSSPIYLATANGAAASLGCLARTLGPAVSGPLFRFGLQIGYVGLPFWLLGVIAGLGGIVSLYLVDHA